MRSLASSRGSLLACSVVPVVRALEPRPTVIVLCRNLLARMGFRDPGIGTWHAGGGGGGGGGGVSSTVDHKGLREFALLAEPWPCSPSAVSDHVPCWCCAVRYSFFLHLCTWAAPLQSSQARAVCSLRSTRSAGNGSRCTSLSHSWWHCRYTEGEREGAVG